VAPYVSVEDRLLNLGDDFLYGVSGGPERRNPNKCTNSRFKTYSFKGVVNQTLNLGAGQYKVAGETEGVVLEPR
jgi:hypothetical protein